MPATNGTGGEENRQGGNGPATLQNVGRIEKKHIGQKKVKIGSEGGGVGAGRKACECWGGAGETESNADKWGGKTERVKMTKEKRGSNLSSRLQS